MLQMKTTNDAPRTNDEIEITKFQLLNRSSYV